jgi:hypothetical protein
MIGGFAGFVMKRDSLYRKGTAFTEKGHDGDFSARFVNGAYVGVMCASD